MKKGIMVATLLLALVAFVGVGMAGGDKLSGTVVKIDGEMCTVKDDKGKEHMIHVDPKTTKKTGELKAGAKVEAEVDSKGHASWIKVAEGESKPMGN